MKEKKPLVLVHRFFRQRSGFKIIASSIEEGSVVRRLRADHEPDRQDAAQERHHPALHRVEDLIVRPIHHRSVLVRIRQVVPDLFDILEVEKTQAVLQV